MTERLHSYINMEMNRFLKIEKPEVIYIPKLPKTQKEEGIKQLTIPLPCGREAIFEFACRKNAKKRGEQKDIYF